MKEVVKMKKKIRVGADLLTALATADLTTYHYKLWMLYAIEPITQAQAADQLGVKRQNVNRYTSELMKQGLITVDRIEGKNKFLTAVTDSKPQWMSDNSQDKDQVAIAH